MCKLCTGAVAFILRHERDQRLRFAPLQSAAGKRLLERFGIDPAQMNTFVVIAEGRAYVRSDAAIRLARFLSGGWRLLGVLRIIPRPVRDYVYDVVARNRYHWFGRRETCMAPTPGLARRFLA